MERAQEIIERPGTLTTAASGFVRPIAARAHRPLVELKSVGKVYSNGTEALRGVDLTIPQQLQFVSVLGPSGCGKSTLLRIIAGLDTPSEGTVEWPSTVHDVTGRPMPGLGFVFQEPTLMPWATVFENLYLPFRAKSISRRRARDRIANALRMVRLEKFAKAYPRELSGGMMMRVSIARALVTRPRVLLMDEPFAALDEITRLKLNHDLLDLWKEHELTVIFVTHSVYESVYLSNRIVVMGAQPGHVFRDIAIDEPYPRDEMYRTSSTYNEYCRHVSATLAEAMAGLEEDAQR
jgi:NitT/TauT family transport system ATP-binding protein